MATQVVPTKRKWGDVTTVTLIVGESKTAFHLHEAELFEVSPFFKAAFTSKFKEGSERTMTLREDDVDTFEDFAEWLYHRSINIPTSPSNTRFTAPLRLFVLADKYHVNNLKDVITKKLFLLARENSVAPWLADIAYVYAHTPQSSGIRKLMADWCAWEVELEPIKRPDIQAVLRQQPEFSADVTLGLVKRLEKGGSCDPFNEAMPLKYIDQEPKDQEPKQGQ